jgi:hypothetical protein
LDPTENFLFVADSESSSIRVYDFQRRAVSTLVGGALDPQNLFAFGDVEGTGFEAKLQHPLSVAHLHSYEDNLHCVAAADSYYHKIKLIDATTRRARNWLGSKKGLRDGVGELALFSEPGGLAYDPTTDMLFVADTNNGVVRYVDVPTALVSTLSLVGIVPPVVVQQSNSNQTHQIQEKKKQLLKNPEQASKKQGPEISLPVPSEGKILLSITVPEGTHFTSGAPSQVQIFFAKKNDGATVFKIPSIESIQKLPELSEHDVTRHLEISYEGLEFNNTSSCGLDLHLVIYKCSDHDGLCSFGEYVVNLQVKVEKLESYRSNVEVPLPIQL